MVAPFRSGANGWRDHRARIHGAQRDAWCEPLRCRSKGGRNASQGGLGKKGSRLVQEIEPRLHAGRILRRPVNIMLAFRYRLVRNFVGEKMTVVLPPRRLRPQAVSPASRKKKNLFTIRDIFAPRRR